MDSRSAIYNAIWTEKKESRFSVIKSLVDNGEDIHERDAHELTLLHHAVVAGDHDVVRLLLDAGANPNAIDNYGRTPLFYTAFSKEFNSVKLNSLLIERGAITSTYDINGLTADQFVASMSSSKFYRPEIVAIEPNQDETIPVYRVRRRLKA